MPKMVTYTMWCDTPGCKENGKKFTKKMKFTEKRPRECETCKVTNSLNCAVDGAPQLRANCGGWTGSKHF